MDTTLPSSDRPVSIDGHRVPAVILFDVTATLSDMSPIARRFVDVGAPAHLAATWFAALLRDGFALTAAGSTAPFALTWPAITNRCARERLSASPRAAISTSRRSFSMA